MNIKHFLLTAMSLALGAGISASSLAADNYLSQQQPNVASGTGHSEDLANLAADLAKTAARLQELQNAHPSNLNEGAAKNNHAGSAFIDVNVPQQYTPTKKIKETTVRWLNASPTQQARTIVEDSQDVDLPAVVNVTTNVNQQANVSTSTSNAKPALRRLPIAKESRSNSQVVPARANENDELFYTVQAIQEEIEPEPAADSSDKEDSDSDYSEAPVTPVFVSDNCCGPTCDDICCQPCRPPRRRILVVGTEAVFLSPDLNGTRSRYIFDDFTAPPVHYEYGPGAIDSPDTDIDDFYIAPRLWLGVQGECWGVVGRYFHLRAGEHGHDQFLPVARDTNFDPVGTVDQGYDVNSIFEAYYADLELTRNFCVNGCKNQFSFGARYALIEHDESVFASVERDEGILRGHARSNREAHGTGLTFGLNGRKPLFCNSCAHWFYNLRSSVLWGCSHNSTETWSESVLLNQASTAVAFSDDGAFNAIDDDLFIGEVQLGIEWNFAMRCLPAKSFFRAAFEYQYWDSSRGQATALSSAGFGNPNNPDVVGTSSASAPGIRADLIGFHVGTGFTW